MTAENLPRFDLDGFLPYRVNVLATRLSVELASRYGKRFGLSIPEWRVLAHLSSNEMVSVREIYRRVEMDKAKVSRAAARLQAAGLVRKAIPRDDRRLVALSLTAAGRRLFSDVAPLALEFEREVLAPLGEAEAREFRRLLDKLLRDRGGDQGSERQR